MQKLEGRAGMRAFSALLLALLISMIAVDHARSQKLERADLRIRAVYEKAFYETCELTEGISNGYRKLLVAGDDAQMLLLLGEISRRAQAAAGDLAILPLGEETVAATIKFINQAEDYAISLAGKIATGAEPSESDYKAMRQLSDSAAEFSTALSGLLERYESGQALFSGDDPAASEPMRPLTNSAQDYPVLLYDGPFSDNAAGGSFEMLRDLPEVTLAQAEDKLRAFIPVDTITFTGESKPEIEIYEFSLVTNGYTVNAGVTKRGGEVLYMLPETRETAIAHSPEALYAAAEEFLARNGYGAVEMSYSSRYDGMLTINYAPVQDGVVLYPDLIKVQLSMRDASVVGFDAKAYLKNHTQRKIAPPKISRAEAVEQIGVRLEALSVRLCVIPQNGAEYYCYEIAATDGEADFLVYIDAETGVERELMQVVSRMNGTLVM